MSIFDDPHIEFELKFSEAMKSLSEKEKEMHEEFPEFFEKAKRTCLNLGSGSVKVRKSGTASKGTYVIGPVVAAKPAYYRRTRKAVVIVFECEIETTHPATGAKHRHKVFIEKLPR